MKYNREYTPDRISELKQNEVFVFGSNLAGAHGGGAARLAMSRFGAIWGQGVGLQGQSYAIPTMQGGVETIKPYVDDFINFAIQTPGMTFLVTQIGCGIAGFSPQEIAPLFEKALAVENIILPKAFVALLPGQKHTDRRTVSWNPETDFLAKFRASMEKVRHGDPAAYQEVRKLRVDEFFNTVKLVLQGHYDTADGRRYQFPDDSDMIRNTVFYSMKPDMRGTSGAGGVTTVEVRNTDCLLAAMQLKEQGFNPAVLNMASRRVPGGGVLTGAGAQEENLFRRTNLFRSLFQFAPYAEEYSVRQSPHQYPLDPNFGGVYTPDAICFRESEQSGYALLDNPVSLSFISVAGMNRPDLTPEGMIAEHHVEPIKNKIRTIFRIGLLHRHDSLVLGALGCGAFRNPPSHVARIFHEVMDEPEIKNKYRRIVFAILDDHNAHKSHNPEGNFKPFAKEFISK